MPSGLKNVAGASPANLDRDHGDGGTAGLSPADSASSKVEQAHSDRPRATLADLPKVVAEAGRSIRSVEGDQAEHRNGDRLIADKQNERHRRARGSRLSGKSERDIVRHVRAVQRVVEKGVLTAQETAVLAEIFEIRKKDEQLKALLRVKESWLDEKLPRRLWDPRAAIPSTRFSPADASGTPPCPVQEAPPANDPTEAHRVLENGDQRCPGRAPAVDPETSEVVTSADRAEPLSATKIHAGGRQTARAKWALSKIPDWERLGVKALTSEINKMLNSEEGREAMKHIGKPVSADTVRRIRESLGDVP
jgi:hypothetical protein